MISTIITCELCGREQRYKGAMLESAEEQHKEAGGTITEEGNHRCEECSWKMENNYFAIDIALEGNKDYQVLAVVHDMDCFEDSLIELGPAKKGVQVGIRRIEKSVYETMMAFGIPELSYEITRHFSPARDGRVFPNHSGADLTKNTRIEFSGHNIRTVRKSLDASREVRALLDGKRASIKSDQEIEF